MRIYELMDGASFNEAVVWKSNFGTHLTIGGGIYKTWIPLSMKNQPEVEYQNAESIAGTISNVAPIWQDKKGLVLEKPSNHDDRILVVVRTNTSEHNGATLKKGILNFDPHIPVDRAKKKVLTYSVGPMDYSKPQDSNNIGWYDFLMMLCVGDGLSVRNQSGENTCVLYKSAKEGLVQYQ